MLTWEAPFTTAEFTSPWQVSYLSCFEQQVLCGAAPWMLLHPQMAYACGDVILSLSSIQALNSAIPWRVSMPILLSRV